MVLLTFAQKYDCRLDRDQEVIKGWQLTLVSFCNIEPLWRNRGADRMCLVATPTPAMRHGAVSMDVPPSVANTIACAGVGAVGSAGSGAGSNEGSGEGRCGNVVGVLAPCL